MFVRNINLFANFYRYCNYQIDYVRITLSRVVATKNHTGLDMNSTYKETFWPGLPGEQVLDVGNKNLISRKLGNPGSGKDN